MKGFRFFRSFPLHPLSTEVLIILRWFISFSCWSGRELSQFLFGSGVPPDQEYYDGGEQDPGDTATEDEAQHDVSVI